MKQIKAPERCLFEPVTEREQASAAPGWNLRKVETRRQETPGSVLLPGIQTHRQAAARRYLRQAEATRKRRRKTRREVSHTSSVSVCVCGCLCVRERE